MVINYRIIVTFYNNQPAIFGFIDNFTGYHLFVQQRLPKLFIYFWWYKAGFHNSWSIAYSLFGGIAVNFFKCGVNVRNLSINIGSGYRAHPLDDDVNDRFYSIRDTDVFDAPATYVSVDESNLYDATNNLIGQGTSAEQSTAKLAIYDDDNNGWYIKLGGSGEKVLAEAMTFDNQVFFATYTPQSAPANSCTSLPGLGKLYAVSLFDAVPVRNTDNAIALTKEDRLIKELDKGGIPSPPTVVFPPGKKPTLLVGNESVDSKGLELTIQKSYWKPE